MKTMFHLLYHLIGACITLMRPGGAKELIAENLNLKQQLTILARKQNQAPNMTSLERLLFGIYTGFIQPNRISKIGIIVKPKTLLKFHRALVKRKYSLLFSPKSRNKPGPRGPSQDLIHLIVEMKHRNRRFGALRIAMQINNTFGLDINKDVVLRVLAKHYHYSPDNNGPSWLSFIGNLKDSLWSIDFFRVQSITLNTHWVMVVLDQYTRRIIGFAVHQKQLDSFKVFYNDNRVHSSLNANTPSQKSGKSRSEIVPIQHFKWKAHCNGLFQLPIAA